MNHSIKVPTIAGLSILACSFWACDPGPVRLPVTQHLVERIDEALAVEEHPRQTLRGIRTEIGFDRRWALLQHPPSTYRFASVPSGESTVLSIAPAMMPSAFTTDTDGVAFEIRCLDGAGGWSRLLALEISPGKRPEDRAWHQQTLHLDSCATPSTTLELSTTCGAANDCRWDHAIWGDPKVQYETPFEPQIRRLALLVSIDTLRPDRLALYGAERPTSPHLEKLAADGIVFETAVAPAPWTVPSHASLLTSVGPETHRMVRGRSIPTDTPLLAEIFRDAGWQTAGFIDTPWLAELGFERGYDHYDAEKPPGPSSTRGAELTRQRLLDWLEQASGDVFVFWHIMDAHGPYGAAAPFGGMFRRQLSDEIDDRLERLRRLRYHDYLQLDRFASFAELVAAYDEGVAAVDAAVGALMEALREIGLYEEATIVVTSDHGESLMDHDVWVGHGLFLTDDEIRVPLIVKLPGNRYAGSRVPEMVRLIDVAPTLLDVLEVPAPETMRGTSLVRPKPGAPEALPELAWGQSSNTGASYLRLNTSKLISEPQGSLGRHLRPEEGAQVPEIEAGEQLYDLRSDPEERVNLIGHDEWQEEAEALRRLARRFLQPAPGDGGTGVEDEAFSEEQLERLRALGYLTGSSGRD